MNSNIITLASYFKSINIILANYVAIKEINEHYYKNFHTAVFIYLTIIIITTALLFNVDIYNLDNLFLLFVSTISLQWLFAKTCIFFVIKEKKLVFKSLSHAEKALLNFNKLNTFNDSIKSLIELANKHNFFDLTFELRQKTDNYRNNPSVENIFNVANSINNTLKSIHKAENK